MKLEWDGIWDLEADDSSSTDPSASLNADEPVDLDRLTVGRHGGGRYGDSTHADGRRDSSPASFGRSRVLTMTIVAPS